MHFFDSHAHLTEKETFLLAKEMLKRASLAKVEKILNICTTPFAMDEGLKLQKDHPQVLLAGSTTPHDVEKEGESAFQRFKKAAYDREIVAVGETGLEYFHKGLNPLIQKEFLIRYLHLARECQLPVIFHCRDAFDDLFKIADREGGKDLVAILHCFTGTLDDAKKAIDRGWFISLSGILTFKKSKDLQETAKEIPLSSLLIETDTPYLAPQSRRGKMNEPAFVKETAEVLADLKGLSLEEVADTTFQNALRALNLS